MPEFGILTQLTSGVYNLWSASLKTLPEKTQWEKTRAKEKEYRDRGTVCCGVHLSELCLPLDCGRATVCGFKFELGLLRLANRGVINLRFVSLGR